MSNRPALRVLVLMLAAACASESRLVKPGQYADPVELNWRAASSDGARVTLRHVIARAGPGSWVRDADWDEYVLVVGNDGPEAIAVQALELASESLTNSRHATNLEALESESRRNLDTLKSIGVAVAVGAGVMTGALGVAGAATAAAFSSFMGGSAAAGTGTLITVVPIVGVIAGGLYAYKGPHARRAGDRAATAYEMDRTGLRLPAPLGPGAEVHGSAFFPITPAPKRLHVRYEVRGEVRELALELEPLSDLHLTGRSP